MSWQDENPIIGKKTSIDEDNPKVDLPVTNFFPTYSRQGEILTGATSGFEALNESMDLSANQINNMNFGTRNNVGEEVGGMSAALYGIKKGIDFTAKLPTPQGKAAKVLNTAIPFASGVVSSWVGGAVGDTLQSVAQGDINRYGWGAALDSAWAAGNRQAIYEALGQAGFSVIGKGIKMAKGQPYDDIEYIQKVINASDGQLTASQVVDGQLLDTVEGLTEAAWGGSGLRQQRLTNANAIDNYVNNYSATFLNAASNLSIKQQGRIYNKAIDVATNQHKTLGGDMFKQLDQLYEETYKKTKSVVQKPLEAGDTGFDRYKMLNTTATVTTKELIQPVSTKPLKDWAKNELKKIKGAESVNKDWRYKEMENILKMDDRISFAVAQETRSSYLANLRKFENKDLTTYNPKDAGAIKALSSKLDQALETAAKDTQSDEFYEQYRASNKFWKTGKENLQNKFMAGLILKDPEQVGQQIFKTGNQSDIQRARIALRYAQKITKGTPEAINFDKTWQTMQAGYLKNVLGGATDTTATQLTQAGTQKITQGVAQDVASREMNITNLKKMFVPNTPANETFKAAFTKTQRQSIKRFISAVEAAQKRPQGAGSFMVTVGQAGLVISAVTLGDAPIAAGAIGGLTIAPYVLSKLLTNPTAVRYLAQGMNTNVYTKSAGGLTTKLIALATGVGEEQYREFQ